MSVRAERPGTLVIGEEEEKIGLCIACRCTRTWSNRPEPGAKDRLPYRGNRVGPLLS